MSETAQRELTEDLLVRASKTVRARDDVSEQEHAAAVLLLSVSGVIRAARANPNHDRIGLVPVHARRLALALLGESDA